MSDFAYSAFPWVAFSIGLAFYLTHMNSKKASQDSKQK